MKEKLQQILLVESELIPNQYDNVLQMVGLKLIQSGIGQIMTKIKYTISMTKHH
jgi:hypothetical protein